MRKEALHGWQPRQERDSQGRRSHAEGGRLVAAPDRKLGGYIAGLDHHADYIKTQLVME